jgi:hypothetical protein
LSEARAISRQAQDVRAKQLVDTRRCARSIRVTREKTKLIDGRGLASGERKRTSYLAGFGGQSRDLGFESMRHGQREIAAVERARNRPRPALVADDLAIDQMLRELHQVARITGGHAVNPMRQKPDVGTLAEDGPKQLLGFFRRQRSEIDRFGRVDQELDGGGRSRRRAGIERSEDQETRALRVVRQKGQHGGRWLVDGMHVIDGEDQRRLLCEPNEPISQRLLQDRPGDRCAARLGHRRASGTTRELRDGVR